MSKCLITISIEDADLTSRAKTEELLTSVVPQIAENIESAQAGTKTRGCTVSGSASAGPSGASGTVTVTCTL